MLKPQDLGSGSVGCFGTTSGKKCSDALTDDDFSVTVGGTPYSVDISELSTTGTTLRFALSGTIANTQLASQNLCIGTRAFALSALGSGTLATWSSISPALDWPTGVPLEVRIASTCPTQVTGVVLSTESLTVTEGSTNTFTVKLSFDRADIIGFFPHGVAAFRSDALVDQITVSPDTLHFTAGGSGSWNTARTVTVTGVQDDDDRDEEVFIYLGKGEGPTSLTRPPGHPSNTFTGVRVIVRDDDANHRGIPRNLTAITGRVALGSANESLAWKIRVSWDAPVNASGITSYEFQYKKRGRTVRITHTDGTETVDPGFVSAGHSGRSVTLALDSRANLLYRNNDVVEYRVRAWKGTTPSEWATSSVRLANAQNLVHNLTVRPGIGELRLSWTAPTWTEGGYHVHYKKASTQVTGDQRSSDPTWGWVDAGHTGTTTSHTISGLEAVAYNVRVRDAAPSPKYSPWASATATPTGQGYDPSQDRYDDGPVLVIDPVTGEYILIDPNTGLPWVGDDGEGESNNREEEPPVGEGGGEGEQGGIQQPAQDPAEEQATTKLTATPGDGRLVVRWQQELFHNDNLDLKFYELQYQQTTQTAWQSLNFRIPPAPNHPIKTYSIGGLQNGKAYNVRVRAWYLTPNGKDHTPSAWITTTATPTADAAAKQVASVEASFALAAAYPNPFNPTTTIRYGLPQAAEVKLTVYNVAGQPVQTLVAAHQSAGSYAVEWDATGLAAGLYFYRLQAGEFRQVKKMLLLK